jgi:hypothetical protein
MIIIYQCMIIMLIYCLSMYPYYVDIYLLFMDDAWKKEKLSFELKYAQSCLY